MSEWKTIDSAPKDGTEVDVFITSTAEGNDGGYRVPNAWWCRALGRWRSYNDQQQVWGVEPSHWMPLPASPES